MSRTCVDFCLGPVEAPSVEVNPIDRTVDLVWGKPFRSVIILKNLDELRVLMNRVIEAVQGERLAADLAAET